jgi:large subunit ribosomal protein L15
MYLSKLKPKKGAVRKKKSLGRGNGAGHGQTACRGANGAKARSGASRSPGFEGGQMPLHRRLPKRGFYNPFRKVFVGVNLGDIDKKIGSATLVDAKVLTELGLLPSASARVKILGTGQLSKPVTIKADAFSKQALEKIEKGGGKAEKC